MKPLQKSRIEGSSCRNWELKEEAAAKAGVRIHCCQNKRKLTISLCCWCSDAVHWRDWIPLLFSLMKLAAASRLSIDWSVEDDWGSVSLSWWIQLVPWMVFAAERKEGKKMMFLGMLRNPAACPNAFCCWRQEEREGTNQRSGWWWITRTRDSTIAHPHKHLPETNNCSHREPHPRGASHFHGARSGNRR